MKTILTKKDVGIFCIFGTTRQS